jgi:hypothetical protein
LRPQVSISGAQKTMRRVMTQVNSGKLPDKLLDIEIATQMS